jgi:tetratricopeptide (TPR) repeat protein
MVLPFGERVMRAPIQIFSWILLLTAAVHGVKGQNVGMPGLDDLWRPCQGRGCSPHKKFLYWAAKGQSLMLAREYEESNFCFEQAYIIWVDKNYNYVKSNEDSYDEVHEFMMVIYYKTLNYLTLGRLEDAMVECKRLNEWLLKPEMHPVVARLINEDPLLHSLMGIVFDLSNQTDDALICYENALHAFALNYRGLLSKHLPQQLIHESELLYSLPDLHKEYASINYVYPAGRLLVIWNNGQGPAALVRRHDYRVRNSDMVGDDQNINFMVDEIQDTLLSFFTYKTPVFNNWEITRNGNKVKGELLMDESWYAIRALEYRLKSPGIHVWRRGPNWGTLPNAIYFAIVPLQPGTNNFRFTLKGDMGLTKTDSVSISGDGGSHFFMLNTLDSKKLNVVTRVLPSYPGFRLEPKD